MSALSTLMYSYADRNASTCYIAEVLIICLSPGEERNEQL